MFKNIARSTLIIGVAMIGIMAVPITHIWLAVKLGEVVFSEVFWLFALLPSSFAVINEVYSEWDKIKRLARVVRYGKGKVEAQEMKCAAYRTLKAKRLLGGKVGDRKYYVPVSIDVPKSYTKHAVLTAHNKGGEVLLGGETKKDFHVWNARAIGLSDVVIAPVGWKESPLVKREVELAIQLGIPVEYMEVQNEQKTEEKDTRATRSID